MDRSEAALAYLRRGWSVLPVIPDGKRPAISWKGLQEHYASKDEVLGWWQQWPDANVGVITGKISNLSIIDVDGATGLASIQAQPVLPPRTRTVKTPHGFHLYYNYRADWHTGAAFLPGIDVRSDGGYVVAPPSRADDLDYKVVRDNPIVDMTLPVTAFESHGRNGTALPSSSREEQRPTWVREALSNGVPEQQRNDTATRLVGYFHSLGTPADVIEVILGGFAERCQPPMNLRELQTTIQSVVRYQRKHGDKGIITL